jgi:hypothetical protein
VKQAFLRWTVLAAGCGAALGLIVGSSIDWLPVADPQDPYMLVRYVALRLTAIAIAAPALTGLMLFVDFVTPGDWMKAIGDDAKACSFVMSAVILVIGAVLCWT